MSTIIFSELAKNVKVHITNKEGKYDQTKAQAYLNKLEKETESRAITKTKELIKTSIESAKVARPKNLQESSKKNYLLSIDGGGTRGIMAAIWLKNIERDTKQKISNIFTAIGGTSIGGILALATTLPEPGASSNQTRAASTLEELFTIHAAEIFPTEDHDSKKSRFFKWLTSVDIRFNTYNRSPLENLLKRFLGSSTILKSALSNIKVTSVTTNHNPVCFSNLNNPLEKGWEVGCATSAAPSYFAAAMVGSNQYVDGGLWANNPAAILLGDELAYSDTSDNLRDYVVLSLGTGLMPVPISFPEDVDGIKDGLSIAGPVISMLMNTHSVAVDRYLNDVLNKSGRKGYLRVNPNINKEIKLDDINPDVFDSLIKVAEVEYAKQKTQIMELLAPRLAELLLI